MERSDLLRNLGLLLIAVGGAIIIFMLLSFPSDSLSEKYTAQLNGLIYVNGTETIYTGKVVDTVNNRIIEYEVKNGRKNGEFKISYPNGQVQVKGQLINNRNEGEWRYFDHEGKLETIGHFKNDKPDSVWVWYHSNGKIKEKGNYSRGERNGVWILYDEEGFLLKKITFSMGREVNIMVPSEVKKS
jgi:antitoxin component YwqK of YwqJK toxin-antitoxin module